MASILIWQRACPRPDIWQTPVKLPSSPHDPNHRRVQMADYPSTGSTYLASLLRMVTAHASMPSPVCSVYEHDLGSCNRSSSAVLVKSHFPSQEVLRGRPLSTSVQYNATMHNLDGLLVLLRDPLATLRSNVQRWGGHGRLNTTEHAVFERQLASGALVQRCWAAWWQRVCATLPARNVLVVRYEQLCTETVSTLLTILRFVGGIYAAVPRDAIARALAKERSASTCKYANDKQALAPTPRSAAEERLTKSFASLKFRCGAHHAPLRKTATPGEVARTKPSSMWSQLMRPLFHGLPPAIIGPARSSERRISEDEKQ